MKFGVVFSILLCFAAHSGAQIISGPMLGPVEFREARVWLEVSSSVQTIQLVYSKRGQPQSLTIPYTGQLGKPFNPIQFHIGNLDMNTTYLYSFIVDGKASRQQGSFTTKDLWQWRKPAPNFSFLAGSCAYFNEPAYDRPGKPYGGDSLIFETMARENAAFMLWLGDNWYTREVDYFSQWGLWYRAHHHRRQPVLQNFLKAMPHLAIWDDHDFGPDNSGKDYILKEESRAVFQSYWLNKSYGQNGEGIFTQYSHGDVDIFMLDDRWWRSSDRLPDSLNGQPNPEKRMFGPQQMDWLKNSLLNSDATFKIIATGSQVLNPVSPVDKMQAFPVEYNDLMAFLVNNRINGVLFLTGDRHHSEIIRTERQGTYPLYDITCSPLTAGTSPTFPPAEQNNAYRVFGFTGKRNYGRFSIAGAKGQRTLTVQFTGAGGERLGQWAVTEADLKTPEKK
ncbi:MAG TPA: alkaline phosphatase D family protein [Flavisolibacter sp.]|nr:alkaline phosphatase D family protein [Flavisolibacter sp.]